MLAVLEAAATGGTLFEYLNRQFSIPQTLDFFVRILLAGVCGAAIGFERSRRFKGAGIRTHIIVCCGAALLMIISKYGFADLASALGVPFNGTRGADPARIAAQVVSGISFLGAGVIFKNHGIVKGLTTAAGLWVTAGIGLAMGSGLFSIGLFTTVLVAVSQIVMHKFKIGADSYNTYQLQFTLTDEEVFPKALTDQFAKWEIQTTDSKIERLESGISYSLTFRTTQTLDSKDVLMFFDRDLHAKCISIDSM